MRSKDSRRLSRKTKFEALEDRQMFSADPLASLLGGAVQQMDSVDPTTVVQSAPAAPLQAPPLLLHSAPPVDPLTSRVPDFWQDPLITSSDSQLDNIVAESLASANAATGLTSVRQTYGLTGVGQTVAVIDTGTAYTHYALGGGLGANYRVVGGWDFAENDANPYDDAPDGGHGTHVSGIIGGNMNGSVTDSGVAPGVDLVSLRVFDDNGAGYYSWVDSALQWVHTHRTSFANPITAVNLSLGSDWNSDSIPSWAMLESSLAQLEADGITITVSAGNSFTTYNSPGLSYPAASPHVIPVMSEDDNGTLSYFSQRSTRAIAAPGHYIISTVPDYGGNHNGIDDDFASYSGTSMASPYVAGAGVLVREVMQMTGQTNITEWTIYNQLMNTADSFVDSATGLTYKRINMGRAISSLLPSDDYSSLSSTAFDLGTLSADRTVNGLIGSVSDADYFKYTAAASGTVTITATGHYDLSPTWTASGGTASGNTYTFQVTAGQTYTFGLKTNRGIGTYSLTIHESAPPFPFTDWGTVAQWQNNGVANTGTTWYRVTASQAGFLTAEASFTGASGAVTLAWYNGNQQRLAAGTGTTDSQRAELTAVAGQQYYLVVAGNNADIDFRLTDLVAKNGATVTVNGTSVADSFSFLAGASQYTINVNGTSYQFTASAVNAINFVGAGGNDSITMTGSSSNETGWLRVAGAQLSATSKYTATASNIENIAVYGGGGADSISMYDSAGDDTFAADSTHATMTGAAYQNDAFNFASVIAYTSTGNDEAALSDSAGDDTYMAWTGRALLTGAGYSLDARGFDRTFALATTGNDVATFVDGAGDDVYAAWTTHAVMYGTGYFNDTAGFKSTIGVASVGNDQAFMFDSNGDDTYGAWSNRALLQGAGFSSDARGFDRTFAAASTGNDTATFFDTTGNDTFSAWSNHACMYGSGYFSDSAGFEHVIGIASTGTDQAFLFDSSGDDTYEAWSNRAILNGSGFLNDAQGFDRTYAGASIGNDTATFHDSAGDDVFSAWSNHACIYGAGYFNDSAGFKNVVAAATTGNDQAFFYDSAGDDTYEAWSNRTTMYGTGYSNEARGFKRTVAAATTGNDHAILYDSAGDDSVHEMAWGAYMNGASYNNEVHSFDRITADSSNGGTDTAFSATVNYVFERVGNWV